MKKTRVASPETELANALGLTRETCIRYLAQGMPRADVAAARAWVAAKPNKRGGRPATKPLEWRDRKARADALRAEDALARERGRLIPRADVERMQVEWVDQLVTALEALPPKLTPLLVAARGHAEVEATLTQYCRSLRVQLSAQCSIPVEEVAAAPVVDDVDAAADAEDGEA